MQIQPHTDNLEIVDDDYYLICSDGISDAIPERCIYNAIKNVPLTKAGDILLQHALDVDGNDSITFFLVHIRKTE